MCIRLTSLYFKINVEYKHSISAFLSGIVLYCQANCWNCVCVLLFCSLSVYFHKLSSQLLTRPEQRWSPLSSYHQDVHLVWCREFWNLKSTTDLASSNLIHQSPCRMRRQIPRSTCSHLNDPPWQIPRI